MEKDDKKAKAIAAAKDIILRLARDKLPTEQEMAILCAINDDDEEDALLFYLKDIKALIEKLIQIIEEK